jgi:hypothetical protein
MGEGSLIPIHDIGTRDLEREYAAPTGLGIQETGFLQICRAYAAGSRPGRQDGAANPRRNDAGTGQALSGTAVRDVKAAAVGRGRHSRAPGGAIRIKSMSASGSAREGLYKVSALQAWEVAVGWFSLSRGFTPGYHMAGLQPGETEKENLGLDSLCPRWCGRIAGWKLE